MREQEEGYEDIRGEIEMLQQCSHPNVVRYFGSYQGEDYLWVRIILPLLWNSKILVILLAILCEIYYTLQIVMEYCGGGSVADLMGITEEPFDESQIAYVCREALKVAHTPDPLVLNK